jgi:hypothetical protein
MLATGVHGAGGTQEPAEFGLAQPESLRVIEVLDSQLLSRLDRLVEGAACNDEQAHALDASNPPCATAGPRRGCGRPPSGQVQGSRTRHLLANIVQRDHEWGGPCVEWERMRSYALVVGAVGVRLGSDGAVVTAALSEWSARRVWSRSGPDGR